jgi:hypothetical protein
VSTRVPSKSFSHLPVFFTFNVFYHNKLRLIAVPGDGNRLFRALLTAAGFLDDNHLQLRKLCVQHITQQWPQYTHQANAIHQDAPDFAASNNEPFPSSNHYDTYMLQNGKWGSEFEAFICAQIINRPVTFWSANMALDSLYSISL